MQTAAGDAVDAMYDNNGAVSEQVKAEKRHELGLDQPFFIQYTTWLGGLVTGDMGASYITNKPVFETFVSKLPATIFLTLTSILLTVLISIPFGILSAVKHNRFTDYLIRFFSFIGNSLPGFFVSLLLIYFFALKLKLFPVMGSGGLKSIVLPTLTLAIAMSSKYTRQVRTTVLEELNKDYVMGARARGIREPVVLFASVLKASMLTIITLLALSIGSLLGGTAIIESIFMWDGVGKLAVDSIMTRDYPMIQAYVIWMAMIYVGVNLATDIIYHYLDPRIRLEQEV
jgi:peptide/nickel transport system permease protein